jgi:3-hydroxyacyl-[acyl-carrier-protein] dehydratase
MISDIEQLVPHRKPMIMIESLVEVGSDSATARKTFSSGEYGLDGRYVLEPLLIECLAQTVAALQGYHARKSGGEASGGMLVSVDSFEIYHFAVADSELELKINISRYLGPFCFATGHIRQDGQLIAEGKMKFYIEGGDSETTKVS